MWDLYSIGDAAYLSAVLNAVAMLAGAADMRTLAAIGFSVGFLLMMLQGIIQARPPQLQHMLVAWVIYAAMFGPSVKVSVTDVYSGSVRVVDHVPLGPAAIGGLMSGIGYGVTKLFEQAFSTPSMTEYGFAVPLHLLQEVRKTTLSMTALGAANEPTHGADMVRTFTNYLAECTLYGFNNRTRSAADILRNPNWRDAIGSTLIVPTTELWIGGAPVTKDCPAAWTDLSSYLTTNYVPKLNETLAAHLRMSNPNDVPTAVNAALNALAGAGVQAQDYMVMASFAAMLPAANAADARSILHGADAVAIEQAAQQRNTQWASEERLFSRIVRPMMTFFEAFLYAVSPLMVFAIGLGPTGIGMVGKYLLFGLWIQLWQPILAIINLYIIMAVRFKMDALQDVALGNTPLPSIEAIWKLDFILSDYLGVGGMLAASTPAISLMLIYGSAVTATHLAGRLQGGDHVNEKIASPDVVQPSAGLSLQPLMNHGPLSGTVAPGAEQQTWTANIGQEVQRQVRSSQQASQQASMTYAAALASAAATTAQQSGESFDSWSMKWMQGAEHGQADRAILQDAEQFTQKYGLGEQRTNAVAAILASGVRAAAGVQGTARGASAGLEATLAAQIEQKLGITGSQNTEMAKEFARNVTADQSAEARRTEGISDDVQQGRRNVFTAGLSSEQSSRLGRTAQDALSRARTLEQAQSHAERFGTLGAYSGIATGAALMRPENQVLNDQLERTISRYNLDGDRDDEAHRLIVGGVTADRDQARAIAGMGLLLGHTDGHRIKTMTPAERAGAQAAGIEILSREFNLQAPSGINAERNTDLAAAVPSEGAAQGAVSAAGLQEVGAAASAVRGAVDRHWNSAGRNADPQAVDDLYDRARGGVGTIHHQAEGVIPPLPAAPSAEKKSPEPGLSAPRLGATRPRAEDTPVALSAPVGNADQVAVTSGFSTQRVNPVTRHVRPHRGVDLGMPPGTPLYAAADGIAHTGVQDHGAGHFIALDHGGAVGTKYMHLSRVAVHEGAAVQRGDLIGYSGNTGRSTGPHLHFEVWRDGQAVDPQRDPLTHLGVAAGSGHHEQNAQAAASAPREEAVVAPAPLRGVFAAAEARHGLPTGLLTAIAWVESHFNPTAVSDAGAQGIFQITPATAADYAVCNPFDPREAAEGAAKKLASDHAKFGSWNHAVMAYNAGTGRLENSLAGQGAPLSQETFDYSRNRDSGSQPTDHHRPGALQHHLCHAGDGGGSPGHARHPLVDHPAHVPGGLRGGCPPARSPAVPSLGRLRLRALFRVPGALR